MPNPSTGENMSRGFAPPSRAGRVQSGPVAPFAHRPLEGSLLSARRCWALGRRGHPWRVVTALRRRTAGAKRPRPCPRAGLKSRPGPFVEAPVGACLEQGLATFFRALQVPRAVQALAQLQRCARRRQEDGRRLEPAPVLHGASTPSCSRSPTGRAGRGRGQRCAPPAPHRPLRARHDPAHPLHRSRTARRPHAPSDPSLAPRPLNPSPRPFVQALATGRRTSSRLDSGAARRRGGGGLGRPGRPEDPAARRRLGGGAGARRAVAEAGAPPPWRGGADRIYVFIFIYALRLSCFSVSLC